MPRRVPQLRRLLQRLLACSRCEHLSEDCQGLRERRRGERAESLNETFAADSPDLVENDVPVLAGEANYDAKWVRMTAPGQRCNDEGANMGVEVVRRYDHAGACLANLPAAGRIELDEPHLTASNGRRYHAHSSSKRVAEGASRR